MSLRRSTGCPVPCSGDIYCGVPIANPATVALELLGTLKFDASQKPVAQENVLELFEEPVAPCGDECRRGSSASGTFGLTLHECGWY